MKDEPGFVVNRLIVPYLSEALVMASQGVDIRSLDQVMMNWGMPMGPIELLDRIGIDIAAEVLNSLRDSDPFVKHLLTSVLPQGSIQRVVDNRWLGRKTGKGFTFTKGRSGNTRLRPFTRRFSPS